MQNNGESLWNEIKPVFMILGAIIIWMISFILFIVGLRFNQALMVWGRDLTIPVSAGIALVITIVELSLVDSVLDDEKDWILIVVGFACYALGITVGYLALMSLLSLQNPRLQQIVSLSLAVIFEIGPERLLLMGLRKMNISFNIRGLFNSFNRPKRPKQSQPAVRPVQPQNQRYTVPPHLQQSTRMPQVPRPGSHQVGRQPITPYSGNNEEEE